LGIKKSFRVKKSSDFEAIFKAKNSFANRAFIVYELENSQDHFRVGLSVSKKLGHAVVRNRIKRLIRAVLKDLKSDLTEKDFVVIARKGVENFNYAQVQKNLVHVLTKSNIIKKSNEKKEI
jgi:ribonuclease P protein component